jgi:hypothetical protein
MYRRLAIVLTCSLVMVGAVYANFGPAYLPKDRKIAEPPVSFEGIDKHADYIFHLYYSGTYIGSDLIEVKDANAIILKFKLPKDRVPVVSSMSLLAMDRTEFDKRKKDDPSLKWLNAETKGVLSAKLSPPPTTVPVTVKEIPLTTYRVTLKDGKLSAEKVEDEKKGEKEPTGLLPTWTFGIAGSVSIAWLGIWVARRRALSRK